MSISASIIIPCYNSISTLDQLIQNLKKIPSDNFEVIFVDDGSTDESASFFEKHYPSAQIIKQENHGLAYARNVGAKKAKGKYLQFIDADDTIHPDKIHHQLSFASNHDVDVIYSDWRMVIVNENGIEDPEDWVNSKNQIDYIEALLSGWWNPFHSYLFKREAYFNVGGSNPSLINAQDFDLVLRMAINGYKFAYLPGKYSNYFRFLSAKSLARGPKERYWKNTEAVVLNALELLKQANKLSVSYRKAAAYRLFHIARNVYSIDKAWNKKLIQIIHDIHPSFYPNRESWKFKTLYKIVGYQLTEYIINIRNMRKER